MKNQYFGDIRDLFKYDLILSIIQDIDLIHRLLFIPMLTKNDESKEGNKIDYNNAKAGTSNLVLLNYLKNCVNSNKRDIVEIVKYFISKGINIFLYQKPFEHETRGSYFSELKTRTELFCNSLVFVDPDIGLEINRSTDKHILYDEVNELFDFMNINSILMIYQHFPRYEERKNYRRTRTDKLRNLLQVSPLYISDSDIMFLFLTKNDELREQLERTINSYKSRYPSLVQNCSQKYLS